MERMSAMGPSSIPALYARAVVRKDLAARDRLPEDPTGESVAGFIDALFEVAVRRRFAPDCPVRDITLSVDLMRRRHEDVDVPVLEVEALIRERLGEAVPTGEIEEDVAELAKVLTFAAVVDELALYDSELDDLLVEAERLAEQRGHELPRV
jgi:hypothetical protein